MFEFDISFLLSFSKAESSTMSCCHERRTDNLFNEFPWSGHSKIAP